MNLPGSFLICSAVLEIILFLVCCFYYHCFIHITACGRAKGQGWSNKERESCVVLIYGRQHVCKWGWGVGGGVCPSIRGCADEGGNITVQLSKYNDNFWQFSLQSLLDPCTCMHKHTHHILGTWTERQACNLSFTMAGKQRQWQSYWEGSIHHCDKVWLVSCTSRPLFPSVIVRMTLRQVSHNQWH